MERGNGGKCRVEVVVALSQPTNNPMNTFVFRFPFPLCAGSYLGSSDLGYSVGVSEGKGASRP